MILTLTINPAIDRIVSVDKLVFEDRAYILDQTEVAGGRGVNASVVLHRFGGKTLALLTSGGAAGERMEKSLAGMGFPFEVVRVRPESRTNLTISDKQGLTVKLNEVGHPLAAVDLTQIRHLVEARLAKARWLMICGSMQPGIPPSFYCEIIEMAQARGVKTLLDTDGDALAHGVEAKPTVITPNQHEAERLLGSRGAVGSGPDGVFEALPPRVDALCPIGAGDSLAAAFVWAMDKKKAFYEALRWGVAAGTASAALPGMSFPTIEQTRAIYKQVEVRPAR